MPARALALLAGVVLFAAGCEGESKNRGKIEGKWKVISGPGISADLQRLQALGATPYMEFQPDGTMVAGTDAKQPLPGIPPPKRGTYELLSGDGVRLGNAGRASVVIHGDSMTITTADGVITMKRMK